MDPIMTKLLIILIIFGTFFSNNMLAMNSKDTEQTLQRVAYRNAQYFAQDPRRLGILQKADPDFAKSKFGKCLDTEFKSIPGISEKPGFCHRVGFALGFKTARVDDMTYLQAVLAGVKCSELIAKKTTTL